MLALRQSESDLWLHVATIFVWLYETEVWHIQKKKCCKAGNKWIRTSEQKNINNDIVIVEDSPKQSECVIN